MHRKVVFTTEAPMAQHQIEGQCLPKKEIRTRSDSNAFSHALHTQRFSCR